MSVRLLDQAVPADRAQWIAWWEAWPEREVFAHPQYVALFARPGDRVLCAGRQADSGGVLFPFLLRPLATEPWSEPAEAAWDLVSPYGYGGAFAWNCPTDQAADFWEQVEGRLREHAVVSSFVRLSLFPDQLLAFPGTVEINAPNVVRSLDLTPDELWRDYEHKVRKNVNRAKQSQLEVDIDPAGRRLEDFLAIYYSTMDRREAAEAYFFPREFFEAIVRNLAGQFVFVHILHQQQVVSSELVLVSARHVYSFLGGTLAAAFPLRPNDLLKHEIILWAREMGKRTFVLGGGYGGEDGIYRYKKAFAPSGTVNFQVGKLVHDRTAYTRLVDRRRTWEQSQGRTWQPRAGYFPEYRA